MNGPRLERFRRYEVSDKGFLVYWHFWIGLLITPILLLMAVTGGILLFEDELLQRMDPSVHTDVPWLESLFKKRLREDYFDKILPMVENKLGPDAIVWRVELENRKGRFPSVLVAPSSKPWPQQRYHINMNTGELHPNPDSPGDVVPDVAPDVALGEEKDNDLFASTTLFHRTLYMGWFGRLLVEFTATWLIASTLLGVLLWVRSRPSRSSKPVTSKAGRAYLVLSKMHTTAGIVSAFAIVTIAWNGLHYSELYGTLYHGIARATGQYDYLLDVPKGKQAGQLDLTPLDLGNALRAADEHGLAWQRISVQRLAASNAALMIESGGDFPPSMTQTLYLDAGDHALLARYDYSDLGWQARWNKWSYSLHTGSFGGVWTKVLWMVVLLMLAFLPISACAMTLARRSKQLQAAQEPVTLSQVFPRRSVPEHRWVWIAVGIVGVLFPLIGLLAVAIACASWLVRPMRLAERNKKG